MGVFASTLEKNRMNMKDAVNQSRSWFQRQALDLSQQTIQPLKLIRSDPAHNKSAIIPGEMYLFGYDAKNKAKLPMWDMFPLVFPYKKTKNGFIGLNLHYLPVYYRVQLLDKLMDFRTNSVLNENTKLRFSWSLISGISRYKGVEQCIHQYLTSYVQTAYKKIPAEDWGTALLLPVERFVVGSGSRVL